AFWLELVATASPSVRLSCYDPFQLCDKHLLRPDCGLDHVRGGSAPTTCRCLTIRRFSSAMCCSACARCSCNRSLVIGMARPRAARSLPLGGPEDCLRSTCWCLNAPTEAATYFAKVLRHGCKVAMGPARPFSLQEQ